MTSRTSDSSEWANLSAAVLQATGTDRSCGGSSNRRGQTLAVLQAAGADRPCPRLCSRHNRCGQTLSAAVLSATGADRPCPRLYSNREACPQLCPKRQARTDPVRSCARSDRCGQTVRGCALDRPCPRQCSSGRRGQTMVWPPFAPSDTWAARGAKSTQGKHCGSVSNLPLSDGLVSRRCARNSATRDLSRVLIGAGKSVHWHAWSNKFPIESNIFALVFARSGRSEL